MFVIFGTKYIVEPIKPLIDTYCYHCNQIRTWDMYCEKEYFTLFFMPTFSIKSDCFLVCKKCTDQYDLDAKLYKRIKQLPKLNKKDSQLLHDELVKKLETHQLSGKTETQKQYIKSIRKDKF